MPLSHDRLWKILAERNMTKKEFRLAAGLTLRAIEMLENGEPVRMSVSDKIYDALGVDPEVEFISKEERDRRQKALNEVLLEHYKKVLGE